MKPHIVTLLLTVVLLFTLHAEIIIIDSQPQDEHDARLPFPHHLTQEEIEYWENIAPQYTPPDDAPPPPQPLPPPPVLKPIAEFDQMYGVLVRYPLGIPIELIRQMSLDAKVVTIVANTSTKNQAMTAYTNANVVMANCDFIIAPTDSYWTRDYGPWFSLSTNGATNVIDFHYNRPRPNDNAFIPYYGTYDTLSVYNMNIYQTGGNYMSDGISIGSSTQIAYTENSNNQTLVNQVMADYLGVNTYHVVQDPTGEYIDHIDCWGKMLSPDTILIRAVPTSHPRYTQIEQIATFYGNQMSAWGRPYKIVRVNTPNNQPYTNSLILNNKVFVPIMSASGANDLAALQVYQNAMPGYQIVGIINNTQNGWLSTDALHCRTHELAEKRVIVIEHVPLAESMDYVGEVHITAKIHSFTGHPLDTENLKVYYNLASCGYSSVQMLPLANTPDTYTAILPEIFPGGEFVYYISATDTSGHSATHPFIGQPQAHRVLINADDIHPVITHTPITHILSTDIPLTISAEVTDNMGLLLVGMQYNTNLSHSTNYLAMVQGEGDTYSCVLNIQTTGLEYIEYRFRATDMASPGNVTVLPEEGWFTIEVLSAEPDTTPPVIVHTPITQIYENEMPFTFTATVTDNVAVSQVMLYYAIVEVDFIGIPFTQTSETTYSCLLDIPLNDVHSIKYYLKAFDNATPANESSYPPDGNLTDDSFITIRILPNSQSEEVLPPLSVALSVYPNPFYVSKDNALNIKMTSASATTTLEMFNIKGQRVAQREFVVMRDAENTLQWDVSQSNLSAGIYFIRTSGGGGQKMAKVLILK